jgi:uncharacterized DUF497 family protein
LTILFYFLIIKYVEFRWNDWNLEHATKHGVSVAEAEALVQRGPARHLGGDKLKIEGRGIAGRLIQVIFFIDSDGTFFIIHARPLTEQEIRRFRRRTK